MSTKELILATNMNVHLLPKISHSALLTVVGGLTEFGYNLGNLGWICINIRGNDPLGAEWRDKRATLRDGTINRVQCCIIQEEFLLWNRRYTL